MGIPILVRRHLYIETTSCSQPNDFPPFLYTEWAGTIGLLSPLMREFNRVSKTLLLQNNNSITVWQVLPISTKTTTNALYLIGCHRTGANTSSRNLMGATCTSERLAMLPPFYQQCIWTVNFIYELHLHCANYLPVVSSMDSIPMLDIGILYKDPKVRIYRGMTQWFEYTVAGPNDLYISKVDPIARRDDCGIYYTSGSPFTSMI